MIGETVGNFRIESLAGQGGMGTVYRAHDIRLNRPVALKFIRVDLTDSPNARQDFLKEAQAAARTAHANIAAVYDVLEHDGQMVLVMEWIDGCSLSGQTFRDASSWNVALGILAQIAAGLDAAHAAGVIHRDVKPQNILITPTGVVKITDFGVARVHGNTTSTLAGYRLVGTPSRMAPEQWQGLPIDHRVDIFALGTIAYELLVGQPPFAGEGADAIAYQIVHEPHARPSRRNPALPRVVDTVFEQALAKNPGRRPLTATELINRLRGALLDGSTQVFPKPRSASRVLRLGIATAVICLCLLLIFGGRHLIPTGAVTGAAAEAVAAAQAANPDRPPRLLILPTESDEPEARPVATGLTESLYRTAQRQSGFDAAPHEDKTVFEGASGWLALGARTKADFALVTQVHATGARLTCTAALVALQSGQRVWSKEYHEVSEGATTPLAQEVIRDLSAAVGWGSTAEPPGAGSRGDFDPAVEQWLNRGHEQMRLGDFPLAGEMYDSAFQISGRKHALRFWIGKANAARGHYDDAIHDFRLALGDVGTHSMFVWDTTLPISPSARRIWTTELLPLVGIGYDDTLDNAYHVYVVDLAHRTANSITLNKNGALPFFMFGRGWESLLEMDRFLEPRDSLSKPVRLHLIDSSGTVVRTIGPIPLNYRSEVQREGDLIVVSYRSTDGWPREYDSMSIYSREGKHLAVMPCTDDGPRISTMKGAACVVTRGLCTFHSTADWSVLDSLRLPGQYVTLWGQDSLVVLLSRSGHAYVWDPLCNPRLQDVDLGDTTGKWIVAQNWYDRSDKQRWVLQIDSPRGVRVLTRAATTVSYRTTFAFNSTGLIETQIEGDSIWVFQSNGQVDVCNLRTGSRLGHFEGGPTWRESNSDFYPMREGFVFHDDAKGELALYSRSKFGLRWKRACPTGTIMVGTSDQGTFFIRNGQDNTVTLLSMVTGKLVAQGRIRDRHWTEGFSANRAAIFPADLSVGDSIVVIGELSSHCSASQLDRRRIMAELGSALAASSDLRGAINEWSRSIGEFAPPSAVAFNGLTTAYARLKIFDSAFWAANNAAAISTFSEPNLSAVPRFIRDHWGGSVLSQYKDVSLWPAQSISDTLFLANDFNSPPSWVLRTRQKELCDTVSDIAGGWADIQVSPGRDYALVVQVPMRGVGFWRAVDTVHSPVWSLWNLHQCRMTARRILSGFTRESSTALLSPTGLFTDGTHFVVVEGTLADSTETRRGGWTAQLQGATVFDAASGDSLCKIPLIGKTPTGPTKYAWIEEVVTYMPLQLSGIACGSGCLIAATDDSIICFAVPSGIRRWAFRAPPALRSIQIEGNGLFTARDDSSMWVYSLNDGRLLRRRANILGENTSIVQGRYLVSYRERGDDTLRIDPITRNRGRVALVVIPAGDYFRLRIHGVGERIVVVDVKSAYGQDEERFTFVTPETGKVAGQFRILTSASYALSDSTYYGLLRDGTLFAAPIAGLLNPTP